MKKLIGLVLALAFVGNAAFAAQSSTASASTAQSTSEAKSSASASSSNAIVLTKDNSITINNVFDSEVVAKLTVAAKALDARLPSGDPIYLVINSPGGSIDAGLELIENLSSMNRKVHTINVFSASMGFQTAQGLGDRLVLKNGTLMSHKARGGFSGEFPGQLDSRYNYYLKRITRMDQLAVSRSGGKLTLASYRDLIENEYWCDGQDCVDQGLADKVVTASCDKSLEGTHNELLAEFYFMGMAIQIVAEQDNCPVNTNALKYSVLIDGENMFKDINKKEEKKNEDSWYSSYYSTPAKPKLTSEQLFEINQKVKDVISNKTERKVIKGY